MTNDQPLQVQTFRASPSERRDLAEAAARLRMSRSEFIRQAVAKTARRTLKK